MARFLGQEPEVVEHLVVNLGIDELAPLRLRDRSNRWFIAFGEPSVGRHGLGEWPSGLLGESEPVAPHGIEEPPGLILFGVDAREGCQLALVMTLFDDRRPEHDHSGTVAFDELHLCGVEAEFVQTAQPVSDAPLFVSSDDIGVREFGP